MEQYPEWLKKATKEDGASPKDDAPNISDSPLKYEVSELPLIENRPNTWIEDIYVKVWKRDWTNGLTMKELMTRFIEPESPRYFYLKAKKIQNYNVRFKCWTLIREELQKKLQNSKYNIYGYHNAAVLSFFLDEREYAVKIVGKLIDTIPSPTLLLTMAYFYLEMGNIRDAACILFNILGDSDPNLHAVYLSMKLITLKMNEPKVEPSFYERLFYTSKCDLGDLKGVRDQVMAGLCQLKPNNHLYKLWLMQWTGNSTSITQYLTKEEILIVTRDFLKSVIGQDEQISFKFDYMVNTILGFVLLAGVTLFIKKIILPTYRAYTSQKAQNSRIYVEPKPIPKPKEDPIESYRFTTVKPTKTEPIDSMILKDYEYVDNLFQEIQFLTKEVLPENKSVDFITNRGFKTIDDIQDISEKPEPAKKIERPSIPQDEAKIAQPLKSFGKGKKGQTSRDMLDKFKQFR